MKLGRCALQCISCPKTSTARLTAVGFEPTQLALVELDSTPLDHSGKLSMNSIPSATSAMEFAQSRNTKQDRQPLGSKHALHHVEQKAQSWLNSVRTNSVRMNSVQTNSAPTVFGSCRIPERHAVALAHLKGVLLAPHRTCHHTSSPPSSVGRAQGS